MNPLRLLVVTNYFPSHGGGIERVAQRLIAEFAQRKISTEWLSSDTDPAPEAAPNSLALPVRATNIVEKLTQLPYPIWSPSALPVLWKAISRADVVHVHEHFYLGNALTVLIARLRGRPVVVTQHMGALGLRHRLLTTLYAVSTRTLGRVVFGMATRIVFISANVRTFFSRDACAKASLIFNGIDPTRFDLPPASYRRDLRVRFGIPLDRKVVLFVGRFVKKKGLRTIELLTKRFPEVLWMFAGFGPEDPSAWGRDNVVVLGKLDHSRLPGAYQAADLLILPSSGEGFPLVVQEALSCGLGVLSTEEVGRACPAATDMIRMLPTPRIDTDIDDWAAALHEALHDQNYFEAQSERSSKAHQLWSWDRCATEYLNLFAELTG